MANSEWRVASGKWRIANGEWRTGLAISLCLLLTGCLSSSRFDATTTLANSANPTGLIPAGQGALNSTGSGSIPVAQSSWAWRGELPQPQRPADVSRDWLISTAPATHKPDDTPRQPKTETLLILAQRCYEAAGDAARDRDQRYEHYQRALQIYRQVLRQDPDNEEAQLGLARVYKKLGQTDLAIASLKQLLQKASNAPKNARLSPSFQAAAWYELAMCYGSQQQWDEQIHCLQRACQLEPDNTRFATHLGLALARGQRWQEAEQQLLAALGPARAYYYLALMAEHVGRADLVASYARLAVQADPAFVSHERFRRWLSQAPQARPGRQQ